MRGQGTTRRPPVCEHNTSARLVEIIRARTKEVFMCLVPGRNATTQLDKTQAGVDPGSKINADMFGMLPKD